MFAAIIELRVAQVAAKAEQDAIAYAKANMDPVMFKAYMQEIKEAKERTTRERQHRELCQAIEQAGKNANFWNWR